jgi:hypothetical protein
MPAGNEALVPNGRGPRSRRRCGKRDVHPRAPRACQQKATTILCRGPDPGPVRGRGRGSDRWARALKGPPDPAGYGLFPGGSASRPTRGGAPEPSSRRTDPCRRALGTRRPSATADDPRPHSAFAPIEGGPTRSGIADARTAWERVNGERDRRASPWSLSRFGSRGPEPNVERPDSRPTRAPTGVDARPPPRWRPRARVGRGPSARHPRQAPRGARHVRSRSYLSWTLAPAFSSCSFIF